MLLSYFLAGRRCHLVHVFADEMWKHATNVEFLAQFFHKTVLSMAKKIKHFLRSCTHPLIILSKNDPGMTWNAISSSFPVRTGMASEWLKNDLKCQFSSFPGMIGMTLEWLRNDWKCHFSSFLGMTGMTSEWWFDSFNAHSSHSCHSWFFCYIPSFQPHSAIQNSFRNDEQWGKWGMTSNEWPNLTTFPIWKAVEFIPFIPFIRCKDEVGMAKNIIFGHSCNLT